eukprot:scaffold25848_cov62-Isochrysis_galbana.AAC.1
MRRQLQIDQPALIHRRARPEIAAVYRGEALVAGRRRARVYRWGPLSRARGVPRAGATAAMRVKNRGAGVETETVQPIIGRPMEDVG